MLPIPSCDQSKSQGTELRSAGSTQHCSHGRAGNLGPKRHLLTPLPSNTGMLGGDKPAGLSGTHCCELTSPAHSSPGEGSFLASEHQLPHTAFASRSPGAQQSLQPRCSAQALGHGGSAARWRPGWGRTAAPGPCRAACTELSVAQRSPAEARRHSGAQRLTTQPGRSAQRREKQRRRKENKAEPLCPDVPPRGAR